MKVIQDYTLTLNFVKKNAWIFLKRISLKTKKNYDDKHNFRKSLHILEENASGVQIGDIELVNA